MHAEAFLTKPHYLEWKGRLDEGKCHASHSCSRDDQPEVVAALKVCKQEQRKPACCECQEQSANPKPCNTGTTRFSRTAKALQKQTERLEDFDGAASTGLAACPQSWHEAMSALQPCAHHCLHLQKSAAPAKVCCTQPVRDGTSSIKTGKPHAADVLRPCAVASGFCLVALLRPCRSL